MPRLTMDKAGSIVIPKRIREKLHLEPGDVLELESTGRQIVLRPVHGTSSLNKEQGVWVFYSSQPLTAADTERALQKVRHLRDAANLGNSG